MHAGTMMLTRKQFLGSLVGLGAGALVIGCSDDGGSPEPTIDAPKAPGDAPSDAPAHDAPPMNTCSSTTAQIGTNHGHSASVPATDVAAGVEKTYDIQGTSGHPHTVTITAAMFAMLKAGQTVTATSSNDAGHTHSVTVRCV